MSDSKDIDIQELAQKEAEAILAKYDRESNVRHFTGWRSYIITALLLLFGVYIYWLTIFGNLPEQVRRSAFVGMLIFIGFLLYPFQKKMTKRINHIAWYDIFLGCLGAAAFFYYVINFRVIVERATLILPVDIVMGIIGILVLAELCRRVVGLPILVVAAGFIIYAFVYQFNFATTTVYSALRRVVHQLFYTTDGIIGTPIGVCSTFIVLFIFLAAFLEKSGIANFFIDLANSIAGYASGGPAKVAVIASGFEGIYTGSSIANTVGSGSVTIPTMKKNGYQPEFAAAVEAAASTGGQIVPPIMGAAAFLMAEMTGIPYPVIALSALVPALLYFTGIFLAVHFEAKKLGLKGLPKDQMPHFGKLVLRRGYLLLPIVVLVSFMSLGFTPAYAACIAIISVYVVSFFRKDTRFSAAGLLDAITTGSRNTIGVGIACAVAGTIVGIVSLTGIGQLLSSAIVTIVKNPILLSTGTSLLVALLLTMVSCLILGMGVPTTANYVIMATITAPMVIQTGKLLGVDVPLLAAHMFVFYFGIAADITPPVALASFAGAAIAKSDPMKTAVTATRLAIVVFIVPYVFVFNPAMLFIDASFLSILQAVVTTTIGMFGIAVGLAGFCFRRVPVIGRLAIIAGGLCCINPGIIADIAGTLLIALVTVFQIVMWRREQRRDKRGNL